MHVTTEPVNKGCFLFDLQWLTEEFLPYLYHWEETVSEREGFSNMEKNMMLLSQETRDGLRITGTVYACTYNVSKCHMYSPPPTHTLISELICRAG